MSGFKGRRGGYGAGGSPPKGLFANGVWHCDCNPRKPAVHFETKKEGPNKGKWFRSCQKQTNDKGRCKFFLWDTDAHQREAAALNSNARTEPSRIEPTTPSRRQPSPPPPYTVDTGTSESSRKRKHARFDVDDEYGLEQTDEAFDRELQDVLTAVETPSKAVKTSALATPATRRKLPWQMDQPIRSSGVGLQTPQTGSKTPYDPFNTRLTTPGGAHTAPSRNHESDNESQHTITPSSSFDTPTPSRFRNISPNELVQDVFDFLQDSDVRLNADVQDGLKDLLSKYAKGVEGFKRGRDVIRSTVKARDAKITELTYRVSTLECELEAEKAMVKHLQWEAGAEDP